MIAEMAIVGLEDKSQFMKTFMCQKHFSKKGKMKEAVAVVIFNENNDILFIHNRRYTVGHLEWEIPAGKIEEGETIEAAAKREAKEETGCDVHGLKFLCSQNPSNGMSDAVVHVFAAKVSKETEIQDTDEVSSKRWFKEEEYLELLRTNGIKDGVSILAVLYALQFYEILEARNFT